MIDAKDILLKALRQYRHNTGGEDFVFGYELEETQKIVQKLLKQRNDLITSLQEIIAISDRKQDSWDKAKAIMEDISRRET